MMKRSAAGLLALVVLLAGCGADEDETAERSVDATSTPALLAADTSSSLAFNETGTDQAGDSDANRDADTAASYANAVDQLDENVVDFIAAIDDLLLDTTYAGAALADPEVFVATG